VFTDEFTPQTHTPVKVKPQAADHIVFSEKDSIPHSTYHPSSKFHRATDTCGKLINDIDHVPMPVSRYERKQIPKATNSSMGNILNHDVPQVIPRRGRVPLGGKQTFTLA
jgi:hypothetical protein